MKIRAKDLVSLNGRLRRRGWWGLTVLTLLIFTVCTIIAAAVVGSPRKTGDYGSLHLLVVCASLPFEAAWLIINVRRLHDLGRSGWWLAPIYFLQILDMALLASSGWYTPGSTLKHSNTLGGLAHTIHLIDEVVDLALWAVLGLAPGDKRANRFGPAGGARAEGAEVFD